MIKTIIFDFDGVILDSMSIKTDAFAEIFKEFDSSAVDKLLEFHMQNGGISRYVKIRYFFEKLLDVDILDEKVLQYANEFSDIVVKELIKPKYIIQETLNFIKSRVGKQKLFIASGADQNELRYLCKTYQIEPLFNGIYGSPAPKNLLLQMILNESDTNCKDAIMIGDSINDYDAAMQNNIAFFGFNNIGLKGVGSGYIESFTEFIIDWLLSWAKI